MAGHARQQQRQRRIAVGSRRIAAAQAQQGSRAISMHGQAVRRRHAQDARALADRRAQQQGCVRISSALIILAHSMAKKAVQLSNSHYENHPSLGLHPCWEASMSGLSSTEQSAWRAFTIVRVARRHAASYWCDSREGDASCSKRVDMLCAEPG